MAHEWENGLMLHDWPECGPGRMDIEELYRLFKQRLLTELIEAAGARGDDELSVILQRCADSAGDKHVD